MVIVLAALLVCASMFAIYAFVRTEERHILDHRKQAPLLSNVSKRLEPK